MNYTLKPSLEYMTLAKVASRLWNPRDIRDLMKSSHITLDRFKFREKWSDIEVIILQKVPQLPLPELLKEKTLVFVRAAGHEIVKWIKYHHDIYFDVDVRNEFHWTPQCTVDRKKTAELLVKDEAVDIVARYKLACVYCLEDEVGKLWNKIPEDRKKIFSNEDFSRYHREHELAVLWTYAIHGEVAKIDSMIARRLNRRCSLYQYAFEYAAKCGNRAAAEYFLQKLTSDERKASLVMTAVSLAMSHYAFTSSHSCHIKMLEEYYFDTLVFLLPQMEDEQQVEFFKRCSYSYVLKRFLDWPWQVFFMETASRMWNFLPTTSYSVLLEAIVDKLRDGCADFNYQKLFGEMWQKVPKAHRDIIIHQPTFVNLLSTLFKIGDANNIELMFQDAPRTVKKRFIFSRSGKEVCRNLTSSEAWDLLKFLFQECLSSKGEVIEFRMWLRHETFFINSLEMGEVKLDKFFLLLSDHMRRFSKIKCVEEDICESKRLRDDF